MQISGIRGAVRVDRNDADAIRRGTVRLLREVVRKNDLQPGDVVSAFFTMTPDLDAAFPARAARAFGWTDVPMLGARETPVPGAPDRIVRVLLHASIAHPVEHVYLGDAAVLRPDLVEAGDDEGAAPVAVSPSASDGRPGSASAAAAGASVDPAFGGSLLVVGLGLVGGSVALAVRDGPSTCLLGHDLSADRVEAARRRGAIDAGSAEPDHVGELLDRSDAILLAIPVGRIPAWLDRWASRLRPGTVVMDVGSTKRGVVEAMDRLPESIEAVAAHPVAGSEESGMEAARPDLFQGARWALVETERTGDRARAFARRLVEATGGVPVWIDASTHDAVVARTSHLPYLVSAALTRHSARGAGEGAPLAGPALRDLTRVAGSGPSFMAETLATNWPAVREEARAYAVELLTLVDRVDAVVGAAGDPERGGAAALTRLLTSVRSARERLLAATAPRTRPDRADTTRTGVSTAPRSGPRSEPR